jgi:hypothetical protein
MDLSSISQYWKNFVSSMNAKGVPIPMARYKGQGDPGLTLVIASAGLVIAGICHLGNIDMASAMQFFYASSTLFFGHSWVHKDSKGNTDTFPGNDPNPGP